MRFTKILAMAWAALLAACSGNVPVAPAVPPRAVDAGPPAAGAGLSGRPADRPQAAAAPAAAPARNWDEYKRQAALRIAQANPDATFSGPLPDPLQSIPVLQVLLHRDGSVRDITVLRTPKFVPRTVEMAKQAVRRAAPFAPVGHLPQPWQFSETFLYNDDLKFQLRTLAETP